jgi:HK97 family phage major capsid protein
MKLHELKQKRNTIATDMRALNEKIGDNAWTDEQRTEWNKAKSELEALDERIAREEELRRQDQTYVDENEEEQRNNQDPIKILQDENAGRSLINGCVTVPAN